MSIKSAIIPDNMKKNIDIILEKELFNANRNHVQNESFLRERMEALYSLLPTDFYAQLVERWNWHNEFYEDLFEKAFLYINSKDLQQIGPYFLIELRDVYTSMELVDMATIIISGAIKGYLNSNKDKYVKKSYDYSEEESMCLLLTPPHDTFFVEYFCEHLILVLYKRKEDFPAEYANYLKSKYHAGDDVIFLSRYQVTFSKYERLGDKEIINILRGVRVTKDYTVKHLYYVIENEQRRAFSNIVLYDNYQEKLFAKALVGISGFLFRKKILRCFNETKIMLNNENIYSCSHEEIFNAFNKLIKERMSKMVMKVKHYPQRTPVTCAICCLMMVLNYYNKIDEMSYELELSYYNIYRSKFTDGASFAAISYELVSKGLNVELLHSERTMFKNESYLSDSTFNLLMKEYSEWILKANGGLSVINGIKISNNVIIEKLRLGNIIIAAGHVGMALHALVINGYEDDEYIVCDPIKTETSKMSKHDMSEYLKTPIGSWIIAIKENNRDTETLITKLSEYNKKAKEFLGI